MGAGGSTGRLVQARGQNAEILNRVARAHDRFQGSLPRLRRDKAAWRRLLRGVASTIRKQPLWRLQTVGPDVDDYAESVPPRWIELGGVLLPMYQSEALWINFHTEYPFAVRVATGKIDAVTGKKWKHGLGRKPQNYLSVPRRILPLDSTPLPSECPVV